MKKIICNIIIYLAKIVKGNVVNDNFLNLSQNFREMEEMKGNSAVILLVEDEEAHALLVMRVLEERRVANKIYWVKDGEEALDFLYRRGRYAEAPRPDLILLDLRLPRKDGHEVLMEIKQSEELRVIPVVVLTTSESEADMMRAYIQYANSYLVKPLDFEKFEQMIEHVGFYWLVWNRHPWRNAPNVIRRRTSTVREEEKGIVENRV